MDYIKKICFFVEILFLLKPAKYEVKQSKQNSQEIYILLFIFRKMLIIRTPYKSKPKKKKAINFSIIFNQLIPKKSTSNSCTSQWTDPIDIMMRPNIRKYSWT
jgi:hypothetical protein